MINNTFKYHFSYIKIKIKNERNNIIVMKKEEEEEEEEEYRKHTKKKGWIFTTF